MSLEQFKEKATALINIMHPGASLQRYTEFSDGYSAVFVTTINGDRIAISYNAVRKIWSAKPLPKH